MPATRQKKMEHHDDVIFHLFVMCGSCADVKFRLPFLP